MNHTEKPWHVPQHEYKAELHCWDNYTLILMVLALRLI